MLALFVASHSSMFLIKTIHIACVVLSGAGFLLRGYWMLRDSPLLHARWVRVAPHAVDTLLLLSGAGMAVVIGLNPLAHSWLGAKLLALLVYIVLGSIALKRGKTREVRGTAFVAAILVFAYMLSVAFSHRALPFI